MSPRFALLLCCLFIAYSPTLLAEIAITASMGSDENATTCTGSVTLTATGTAGPFTVVIPGDKSPDIVYENVWGALELTDLCNGSFDFIVYPSRFPTCTKILEVTLIDPSGKQEVLAKQQALSASLQLSLSPNPSDGIVRLALSSAEIGATTAGKWSATVLSGSGSELLNVPLVAQISGDKLYITRDLDLRKLPPGLYHVHVAREDGIEISKPVVLR